jgi:hypothetical protein
MLRPARHRLAPGRCTRGAALAVLALAPLLSLGSLSVAGAQTTAPAASCFQEFERGRGAEIVCEHHAWMSDSERADIRKYTRELVQDASCVVSVRIERALVEAALAAGDHVFEAPPQPVVCTVSTKGSAVPINGTFAPRVVIRDGIAVEATPGLSNVTGVHYALAWPVVQYVNRAAMIRDGMIEIVNAYLERHRSRADATR